MTVAGLGLLIALLIWIQIAAVISGGRTVAYSLLFAATGFTFAVARLITRRCRWAVPATVAASVAGTLLIARDPLGNYRSPLGYANATGAFCMLGVAAALMLSVRRSGMLTWVVALPSIVAFAAVAVLDGCRAATAGIVLVGIAGFAGGRDRATRTAILGGAALVILALVSTTIVGALSLGTSGTSVRERRLIDETLSSARVVLWHEALSIVRARPLAGVGPGRFNEVSPTAHGDTDLGWAHNEFLQMAAETGIVGLALAAALTVWVFVRLWRGERDAGTAVAALALTALLSQAAIDYVLHFPPVTLAAGALAAAGAPPRARGPGSPELV